MRKEQLDKLKSMLIVLEKAKFPNLSSIEILEMAKTLNDYSKTVKELYDELDGKVTSKNELSPCQG